MSRNDASVLFKYVEHQKDLKIVRSWNDLVLLRNAVPTNRLTLVGAAGSYQSWEAVGKYARGGNLLGSFLPEGARNLFPDASGKPVPHADSSPTLLTAWLPPGYNASSTLLFGEPFNGAWRITGGKGSARQLGVVSAFPVGTDTPEKVTISYFNTPLVLGYWLSGAGLLLCAILAAGDALTRRRKHGTT
jgi:hypothetical protein